MKSIWLSYIFFFVAIILGVSEMVYQFKNNGKVPPFPMAGPAILFLLIGLYFMMMAKNKKK
jgi:hypothetical protein